MSGAQPNPPLPPQQPPHQAIAAPTGSTSGRWFGGMRGAFAIAAVAALGGGAYWNWQQGERAPEARGSTQRVGAVAGYVPPATPADTPPPPPPSSPPPPPLPPPPRPVSVIPPEAYTATGRIGGNRAAQASKSGQAPADPNAPETALAAKYQPTKFAARQAAPIPNPAYLIKPGTPIKCVLDTAIDSTLDGIVVCTVAYPGVFGSTGTMNLLPPGTQITGETRGDMKQGQRRLEVIASVAMTPDHRMIDIDSAMTDALGRPGVDGEVETYLKERITGALLMGLASDGVGAATSSAMGALSGGGGTTVRIPGRAAAGTDAAMADAFRNSVNIPPTLRKNQGEVVSITVARWLNFAPAYEAKIR